MEKIPDYFYEIVRDWIIGELIRSGRSRRFLLALLRTIFNQAGARTGYLKLARESGLANNTLAAEYIEQLSDLLAVVPSPQWDSHKQIYLQRKPVKFHFVNLAVALAFSSNRMTCVHDFKQISSNDQSKWLEWLVAQELFRRQCIRGVESPEDIGFWASKEHEIDFVDAEGTFIEVKLGKTSPLDFAWFPKVFPKKKLLVVNQREFQTEQIKGITVEQFLLSDGFPHPYPGMVEDIDIYNNYTRF